MNISEIDFSRLRLDDEEPKIIKHYPNYIKEGTGVNATRRIFYSVPFDNFEIEKIRELTAIVYKLGISLPKNWTDADLLKYLYAAKFSYEKAVNMIANCLEWRSNPASWTITKRVKEIFESGSIYINGRDKLLRPIMVIDMAQIHTLNVNSEDLNAAITIMMDVMIENCFIPGKIENLALIIMSNNLSISKLPQAFIKNWINLGNLIYPNIIDKIFVIRPPLIDRISIKVAEAFMEKDTAAKIQIIDHNEVYKLQNWISPSQLEKKLGGSEPNMTKFWPPIQTAITKSKYSTKVGFSQQVQITSSHITKGNDRFDFTIHHLDDPSPMPRRSEPYSSTQPSPDLQYRATTSGRIMSSPNNSPRRDSQAQQRSTVAARINTNESYREPLLILDDVVIERNSVQEKAVKSSAPRDSFGPSNSPPQMRQSATGRVFSDKLVTDPSLGQIDMFTEAERMSHTRISPRQNEDRRMSYTNQSPTQNDDRRMSFTPKSPEQSDNKRMSYAIQSPTQNDDRRMSFTPKSPLQSEPSSEAQRRQSTSKKTLENTWEQTDLFSEVDRRPSVSRQSQGVILSAKKPISMGYHEEFIRDVIFGQPASTRNSEIRPQNQQPPSPVRGSLVLQKKKSYTLEDEGAGLRSSDNKFSRGKSSTEKAKKSRAPVSEEFSSGPSVHDIEPPMDEKIVFDSNVFDSQVFTGDGEDQRLLNMIVQENREIKRSLVFDPRDKSRPATFDDLNVKLTTSEQVTVQNGRVDTNNSRYTRTTNTYETEGDENIERWSQVNVRKEARAYNHDEDENDVPGDFCGLFFGSKGTQKVNK